MRRFLSFFCLLPLFAGGCAYVKDTSNQNITVLTPGAEDAQCYVYVEGLRYSFNPPETVNIFKSKENLEIDCLAPGNRRKKISVPATIAKASAGNVATGVLPGATWDYLSGAMFRYPDVIEVDFTGMPVSPESMPAQNNPDIVQPEDYTLEQFTPTRPRLNGDREAPPPELLRRGHGGGSAAMTFDGSGYAVESLEPVEGKGDLMDVVKDLGPEINPAGPAAAGTMGPTLPESEPVPLYPGQ
ncbi:MAG: hypothetical protein KDJ75_04005 [Alphaproteobacteria bacterium]|nr:hypothetical protein [Alphaproteobacteria bacterium]